MYENNYIDTDTTARMITLDEQLKTKFRQIDLDRLRNYNMLVSSKQWSLEDKKALDDAGRPANAYNLISPVIKSIAGLEKTGRKKLATIGVTADDHKSSEIMNKVLDWSLNKTNFDRQKSRAFIDAIIGRFGWIYTGYQYDNDPEGRLISRRINPFRIRFDTDNFTDIDMKDCQYVMDSYWYTLEEILQMYALDNDDLWNLIEELGSQYFVNDPVKKKGFISSMLQKLYGTIDYLMEGKNNSVYNNNLLNDGGRWFDSRTGRFQVMEMHERRLSKKMYLYDPYTNKKYDITEKVSNDDGSSGYDNEKLQIVKSKYLDPRITREVKKDIWITTAIPSFSMKVQDLAYPVQNGQFMHTMVTAYDFHADITQAQSVVDELFDPQSDYNKRRSTTLEILMKTIGIGTVMEEGANDGFEDEWDGKEIGGVKHVKKNFWGKWKQEQAPQIPIGLYKDMEESKILFPEISGVNSANRGQTDSKQETGKLFIAKREQGEQMLGYLFDNLEASTLHVGRNAVDNIQHYMTEEREIRIAGDFDNPTWLKINQRTVQGIVNDITISKFDLTISQTPYGRNMREIEYLKLLDIVKFTAEINPQAGMLMLPILIKASDTPYRSEIVGILEKLVGMTEKDLQAAALQKFLETEQARMGTEQAKMQVNDAKRGDEIDNFMYNTVKQGAALMN